ncbi:hypothetical protein [Catellatospora sp. TT07R-123]|uniref:hypothetical protein n=1 Tax=Catellatospora sp. TT07R-123 TaxID=2733863 RepID=UPI001BB42FB8|nr:hypothetical protein [Catellatospora sp. TT07R-123]
MSIALASLLTGCAESARPDDSSQPNATSSPAHDLCGPAAATVEQHLHAPEVEKVVVVGQCTALVVDTTLDDEDVEAARQLCEKAAEVAYTGDVNSIAIKSKGGRELAQGISGMKCLG